jgi:hypothetical protein
MNVKKTALIAAAASAAVTVIWFGYSYTAAKLAARKSATAAGPKPAPEAKVDQPEMTAAAA